MAAWCHVLPDGTKPQVDSSVEQARSPEPAEERPEIVDQQVRSIRRGEVAAAIELGP
jgi:hypothetical protein